MYHLNIDETDPSLGFFAIDDAQLRDNNAKSAQDFAANQRAINLGMNAAAIEIAKIQAQPALVQSQTNRLTQPVDAGSLAALRAAESTSTVLRARTQNLKTTADVSQEVQKPIQSEFVRALPWLVGGGVALSLITLILARSRRT